MANFNFAEVVGDKVQLTIGENADEMLNTAYNIKLGAELAQGASKEVEQNSINPIDLVVAGAGLANAKIGDEKEGNKYKGNYSDGKIENLLEQKNENGK